MQDKPVLLMKKVINLFFRELDAMNTEKLQEPISGHNMIVIEYLIKHEEPVYQRDLENHFFVRRSTVSKVLRLMEEKGMIERLSVHDDARLKQIVLTDYGRRIHGADAGRKAVSQLHRRRNGYAAASFEKTGA